MDILQQLLKWHLPAWLAVLIAALAVLGMALYRHLLLLRLKRFEQQLQSQTLAYEKQLTFVQERHKKRVDALDELNAILLEFNHAVGHVRSGHTEFISTIDDYFAQARMLARKNESLLGSGIYDAVLKYTDAGHAIRDASYCVTPRTVRIMTYQELPEEPLADLETLVGTRHAVTAYGEGITGSLSDDVRRQYGRMILGACELTEEFDEAEYAESKRQYDEAKDAILRTWPAVPLVECVIQMPSFEV